MIAAEKTKRRAALIELDPGYVDTIVAALASLHWQRRCLPSTGATFADREGAVKTADIDTTGLAPETRGAR